MTKKRLIISILIIFVLLISLNPINSIDSSNWTELDIGGNNFIIPPEYDGGELVKNYRYVLKDNDNKILFEISNLDEDDLVSTYGYDESKSDFSNKTIIAGHDIRHYVYSLSNGKNVSDIFYIVDDDIYQIRWDGNNINPNIKEIIDKSSNSTISSDNFTAILDHAVEVYQLKKSIDVSSEDNYKYAVETNKNKYNDHNSQIWLWYFNHHRYY